MVFTHIGNRCQNLVHMQVVISENSIETTYIRITGTGEEREQLAIERSRLESQGFRVVGDLIYELDISEHTIFLERRNTP